jgi:hypothetical protein
MCDYSLHAVASRPAKVGDKLITTKFENTQTRGFSPVDEPNIAVCLLPGTEVAFEADVIRRPVWQQTLFFGERCWNTGQKVGRFRQVNLDDRTTHHDAIEFADGRLVLLTNLSPGQRAMVLQLPAPAHALPTPKTQERAGRPVNAG